MRRIAIVQALHLDSHRIHRKVMKYVGGTTILERGLRTMVAACQTMPNATIIAVTPDADTELNDILGEWKIKRVSVDPSAASSDSYPEIIQGWTAEVDKLCDWVIWSNFVCRPFLRVETIQRMIRQANATAVPLVSATAERGILWNSIRQKLYGIGKLADTKTNPLYYRLGHLGYIHPAGMWDEDRLSELSMPWSIELSPAERIDIDNPEDLEFAQQVQRGAAVAPEGWKGHVDY